MFWRRPEDCVFAAVESELAGVSYILDVGCFNFSPEIHQMSSVELQGKRLADFFLLYLCDVYSEHQEDGGGSHLVFLKGLWLQANHSLAPTTRPSM